MQNVQVPAKIFHRMCRACDVVVLPPMIYHYHPRGRPSYHMQNRPEIIGRLLFLALALLYSLGPRFICQLPIITFTGIQRTLPLVVCLLAARSILISLQTHISLPPSPVLSTPSP